MLSPPCNIFTTDCLPIEGDAQGVVRVLDASGIKSLRDELCQDGRENAMTMLPLHRAVSGFHFHGNHKLLLKTLAVLIEYGADVTAVDHCGNSVLHKAIQVCTSTAIIPVVRFLLQNGADVNSQTGAERDLDTPIFTEIHRLRSRSVEVGSVYMHLMLMFF